MSKSPSSFSYFDIPSNNLDHLLSRLASIEILRGSRDMHILQTLKELFTENYLDGYGNPIYQNREILINSSYLEAYNDALVKDLIKRIQINRGEKQTTGGTSGKKKRATKPKPKKEPKPKI